MNDAIENPNSSPAEEIVLDELRVIQPASTWLPKDINHPGGFIDQVAELATTPQWTANEFAHTVDETNEAPTPVLSENMKQITERIMRKSRGYLHSLAIH